MNYKNIHKEKYTNEEIKQLNTKYKIIMGTSRISDDDIRDRIARFPNGIKYNSLEDTSRNWFGKKFSINERQTSKPICLCLFDNDSLYPNEVTKC